MTQRFAPIRWLLPGYTYVSLTLKLNPCSYYSSIHCRSLIFFKVTIDNSINLRCFERLCIPIWFRELYMYLDQNMKTFSNLWSKKIEFKNLIKMLASLFHSFRKWSGKELWIAVGLRWKLTIYASLLAIVNTTEGKTNISQLQTDPNYLKNVVKKIYFIRSTIHSATLSKQKYSIQIEDSLCMIGHMTQILK